MLTIGAMGPNVDKHVLMKFCFTALGGTLILLNFTAVYLRSTLSMLDAEATCPVRPTSATQTYSPSSDS